MNVQKLRVCYINIAVYFNRTVVSNFGIDKEENGDGPDFETREDRNRGRRQQSKEYVKDLTHIPFRSLDPALCKNRISGDPTVTERQRFCTLEKIATTKIPDK